jgi:hypothetical protein
MKHYFYLDETGDHGLNFVDPNFPIFILAGCLFDENELTKMESRIDEFKIDVLGTTEVILHSREIRKCEGAFQILFDLEKKKEFYEKLNKIILETKFTIIGAGVDKENHIKKYGKGARDPYSISLAFIIERLIFCLDKTNGDDTVDIRIEKRGRREDQQLLDQFNTILDRGTYYVSPERIKKRIASFEFFRKRDNLNGLQIADLCAYPLARHTLNSEEPYIPFGIIENKIYCDRNGKYDGYGLKIFP